MEHVRAADKHAGWDRTGMQHDGMKAESHVMPDGTDAMPATMDHRT